MMMKLELFLLVALAAFLFALGAAWVGLNYYYCGGMCEPEVTSCLDPQTRKEVPCPSWTKGYAPPLPENISMNWSLSYG
jgi:hypothetical protein